MADNKLLLQQLAALDITDSSLFDIEELVTMPDLVSFLEMMQLNGTLDARTRQHITAALNAINNEQQRTFNELPF